MSQITLYVDEDTMNRVRTAAQEAGVSLSRWVTTIIREKLSDEWPDSIGELGGAWKDFPAPEELDAVEGEDLPRETL